MIFDDHTFLDFGHSQKQLKNDAKRDLKSHVLGPNWRHGHPRFDLSFDFGRFGAMPKIIIFGRPPDEPKNRKNLAVERQRVAKGTSAIRRRHVSRRQGSPGPIESRTL